MTFARSAFVATAVIATVLGTSQQIAVRAAGPRTLSVAGKASTNVSMAADGSFVAFVWTAAAAEGATDVYAATSRDAGVSLSAPVRVTTSGDVRANGEQPPRLALVTRAGDVPEMTVIWLSRRSTGMVLLTSRSLDGGRTFTPAAIVSGSEAAGMRGWQSIGADSKGSTYAVWLDHRRLAERDAQMNAMHQHDQTSAAAPAAATKPDGVATAQLSQLYFAKLDGSAAQPVTGGVCFCCKTAIATGAGGEIYLAWRHVYAGNMRDMAFTVSRDGGRTFAGPVRVSEDRWSIDGCPEDGPSLAVDRQSRIHIVWPTVVIENNEPIKAIFHAMSADGRSFGARTRIPTSGQANHPQLTLAPDGSLVVGWDESGSGPRRLGFARATVGADGHAAFQSVISVANTLGTYPVVRAVGDGLLAAWTTGEPSKSVIQVEMLK